MRQRGAVGARWCGATHAAHRRADGGRDGLIGAAFYAAVAVWLLLDWLLDGSHSRNLAEAVGTWLPISGTNLFVLTLLSLYVLRLTSIQPLCKLTKRRFPSVTASSAVLGAGLLWLMLAAGLFPVLSSEPFRAELRWAALVLTPAVVSLALAELCPKSPQAASLAHQEAHGPFKSRWWGGFGRHTVSQVAGAIGSLPLVGAAVMAVLLHSAHGAWQLAQLKRDSVGATGFRLELRGFDPRTVEPISHVGGSCARTVTSTWKAIATKLDLVCLSSRGKEQRLPMSVGPLARR